MKQITGVRAQDQVLIYELYQIDRPNNFEYPKWCEDKAAEYGLTVNQVRRIVAMGERDFLQQVSQASVSKAQQVAELMGLHLEDAFEVLKDQMQATTRRPLTDKDGRMQRDCQTCEGTGKYLITDGATGKQRGSTCPNCKGTGGDVIWLEKPDNPARRGAAKLTIEVFGALAPNQLEIHSKHTHFHVTDEQLHSRLTTLVDQIRSLQSPVTGQIKGSRDNQPRVDGKKGHRR